MLNFFKSRCPALLCVAGVLMAAACGPLPRPFQPAPETPASPLVREAASLGIWIQPIAGASEPMSKLLMESMAEGFKPYGIPAVTGGRGNSRYRLKGRAEINRDDPSLPYVAMIHWTLYDFGGQVIGTETLGVPGSRRDWDYGSPAIIDHVGQNTPQIIAAMIDKEEETLKPVRPRLSGVWVKPIENTPGDGNRSLFRAINTALEGAGIAIAEERRHAEYVLEARFSLAPEKDNLQRVEIVWAIMTPDGREIGRATQKNLVEEGTFSAAWGEVATLVAKAALEGIRGVLQAAGASRHRLGPPARVLKTRVPGADGRQALPPPGLEVEGMRKR